jgi:hypothetical protein
VSSRTASATQRNPVSEKQQQKKPTNQPKTNKKQKQTNKQTNKKQQLKHFYFRGLGSKHFKNYLHPPPPAAKIRFRVLSKLPGMDDVERESSSLSGVPLFSFCLFLMRS